MLTWWKERMGMVDDTEQDNQGNDSGTGKPKEGADSASDTTAKPPEGKVEAEKHGYASELVAYRVVDNLAFFIVNKVEKALRNDKARSNILLVDDLEQAAGGLVLAEITAQTGLMKIAFEEQEKQHRKLLRSAKVPIRESAEVLILSDGGNDMRSLTGGIIGGAGSIAKKLWDEFPAAVGTIADMLAYFDSNYKMSGREMSVVKQALLFSTAGRLADRGLTAFIPGFYPAKDSPLLGTLTDLARRAARLKTERDFLEKELPESKQALEALELPDKERLAKVAKAVRETDAVLLAYKGFRTAWATTPGPKAQVEEKPAVTPTTAPAAKPVNSMEPSKLAQALNQETIERLEVTHLLCLSHFSSGGESTIRERFSLLPDREGFMGGAAVGYVLAGTDGRILAADTLAQFGIIGGAIKEMTEGYKFEDIDWKPDNPHSSYTNDSQETSLSGP